MRVPFIDLSRSIKPIRDEVLADWTRCFDNCEFVAGPTVAKLEESLQEKLDTPHFIACSNGTDAIMVGLQALGIKQGMRVAIPNMTFWAPFEAIVLAGAEPVLIDINPDDLQMDIDEFKSGHEKFRFDAAIFVHLFGWTSGRLDELRQYCKEEGIRLLEDGAQAFQVAFKGESIFKRAELATISFYPAKVLGASGDAGGITTQNPKIGETLRALINHGRAGHYTYDYVGWNARMGGLQASFLSQMLTKIDDYLESRLRAHAYYCEFFAAYPELCRVFGPPSQVTGNGYLSVIQSRGKTGDELAAILNKQGIGCARTYPQTLCEQPPAQNALRTSNLGHSKLFSRQVINLPLFAGITEEECEASARALLEALRKDG